MRGYLRDFMKPTVKGVGYEGSRFAYKQHPKKVAALWRRVIARCYDDILYPTYRDVTLTPEWLDFSVFAEDIKELGGYKDWLQNTKLNAYALDKDKLSKGSKIYSKETCCFLPTRENIMLMFKDCK